ncbi:hypothetical protein [Streptomyces genisteinicus]|uniref:Uncharacterized protein n=1 Tax=Streptomyces genisteinicus TaxID=2768068 RepID=A0A7H0HUW6_9ACTN|nr:hypothetical protein [Streptomyces genisteinicus]QNP64332.1 hypothetical protein IAG43_16410 [Streptomyces genisteinicus]
MNPPKTAEPRDVADWPVCRPLALFLWGWAGLSAFGPAAFMTALCVAWAQPLTAVAPSARAAVLSVGLWIAVLTPLRLAPGVRRPARSARTALLGGIAAVVAPAVFVGRLL